MELILVSCCLGSSLDFKGCFNTPLGHKPLPKGSRGIPFIVGERGIAERVCDIRVCCNFLGHMERMHLERLVLFNKF